jgi:hypothetical protein
MFLDKIIQHRPERVLEVWRLPLSRLLSGLLSRLALLLRLLIL